MFDRRDGCAVALRRPPPLMRDNALFLDFDGTLVELAPSPDAVSVAPGLPELLAALSERLAGAVAVVSGRRVADLMGLLAPFAGIVVGQHGFEVRGADGRIDRPPPDPALERSRAALAEFAARHPEIVLEDKGGSLALHYRQGPHLAETCRTAARAAMAASGDGLRAIDGNKVVELLPRTIGKGRAIAALAAAPPFHGRTPVFAGDDVTDEDGFMWVNDMGGVSIKVGPGASAARHRLDTVAEVIAWLARGARR